MPTWNPQQYGAFLDSRTRPSSDLVQRLQHLKPHRIVDLGCGPGNSTVVCAKQWPDAAIIGIDNSPDMIAAATTAYPDRSWKVDDIGAWASTPPDPDAPVDLIFSSAALQWVPNHAMLFPQLIGKLAPGGALAAQMPAYEAPPNRIMREMAAAPHWRDHFPDGRSDEWLNHPLPFYYDALAPIAKWLDLWSTEYLQIVKTVDGIVEWYKGTGLRPYLDRIPNEPDRHCFLAEFRDRLEPYYPRARNGQVLFPFRRIFIVAGV